MAIIISATYSTFAQFQLGPKLGVSSSRLQVEESFTGTTFDTEQAVLGFHAGLFARISLLGIYIQPEALFTSGGGKILVTDDLNAQDVTSDVWDLNYNRLDIPVMVGKKFGPLRINLGPTFNFVLSNDIREVNTAVFNQVKQEYQDAMVGYQVGIGLDISKLIIDLRYEGNLSKFGDQVSIAGEQFNTDMRSNQFILSLGLNLL